LSLEFQALYMCSRSE